MAAQPHQASTQSGMVEQTLTSLGSLAKDGVCFFQALKSVDAAYKNILSCHFGRACKDGVETFSELVMDDAVGFKETAKAYKEHAIGAKADVCGAAAEHATLQTQMNIMLGCQAAMSFGTMYMAYLEMEFTLELAQRTSEFMNNTDLPALKRRVSAGHQALREIVAKILELEARDCSLEVMLLDLGDAKDELDEVQLQLLQLLMEVNNLLHTSETFKVQLYAQRRKGTMTAVSAGVGTTIQVSQFLALRAIGALTPVGATLAVASILFQVGACAAGGRTAHVAQVALDELVPFADEIQAMHDKLSKATAQASTELRRLQVRLREIRAQQRAALTAGA